jgi:hypothetical protein
MDDEIGQPVGLPAGAAAVTASGSRDFERHWLTTPILSKWLSVTAGIRSSNLFSLKRQW